VDLGDRLRLPDGTPNPAYFSDGVHPNDAGYEVLTQALLGPLKAMLGGRTSGGGRSTSTSNLHGVLRAFLTSVR
jgi:hypothetical protein